MSKIDEDDIARLRASKIGDVEIDCYVLEDGTRVISQRSMIRAILALIAERLKEPTDEMVSAYEHTPIVARFSLAAMLAASPLVPQGGR